MLGTKDKKRTTRRANLFSSVGEPMKSEPSSCCAPRMGRSRLSKRILIAWVEKGKRNFAKNSFSCWIKRYDWQVASIFDRGRKPPRIKKHVSIMT